MSVKPVKRKINGVLLLDKAIGLSSNSALQRVRHLYQAQKAGHTGILDPLASGLLPICFGEATKFAQYLLDADKAYLASLKLGELSSTADAEGEIIATNDKIITQAEFAQAALSLHGDILQTPPMYSALKFQGRALYEYARQGIEIERKQRQITIQQITIEYFDYPNADIAVSCSKGTYIRTLAEDIAKACGSLAYLTALRRTQTAGFQITQAYTYDYLAQLTDKERMDLLLPCEVLVAHFDQLVLSNEDILCLQKGQTVPHQQEIPINNPYQLVNQQGEFFGLVQVDTDHCLIKALRLMATN